MYIVTETPEDALALMKVKGKRAPKSEKAIAKVPKAKPRKASLSVPKREELAVLKDIYAHMPKLSQSP